MKAYQIENYGGKIAQNDWSIGHAFKDRITGKFAFMVYTKSGYLGTQKTIETFETIDELEARMRQFQGDLRKWSDGRNTHNIFWPDGNPVRGLSEYCRATDDYRLNTHLNYTMSN